MAKKKLDTVSTDQLQKELRRRQRRLPTLEARREKLQGQLQEIEAEIHNLTLASNGASSNGGVRRRAKNQQPLAELLAGILKKDKPMKVADIAASAKKAGYKTNARNFSTIVNQTLLKDERFKSTGRGYYVLA